MQTRPPIPDPITIASQEELPASFGLMPVTLRRGGDPGLTAR